MNSSTLIRAKAPLRISFAGGGTDVPPYPEKEGGCVLNATINKYAFGTLRPRIDNQITIESFNFGLTVNCNTDGIFTYDGKLDLAKAAIKKIVGAGSMGFDLFLHSDVPPGTGLGSSSTLMVALVGLLKEYKSMPITDYEIANLAFNIERKELGIKGGLQDQYAATFGGFNFMEFFCDRVIVNPLRISRAAINELEHNLLLCYTGKTRVSSGIIEDQVKRFEAGENDTLEGMRQLKRITIEIKNALLQGQFDKFGELLYYAWESKKKMSPKISNPELEELYDVAKKNGAIGGKVVGAGGGGYMLLYCRFNKKHKIAAALYECGCIITDFCFEPRGLQIWQVNDEKI